MKFLQKYKNKIFALCLAAVLLSCFMGFSLTSSASPVNVVDPLPISGVYFELLQGGTSFFSSSSGEFTYTQDLGISSPSPTFKYLYFYSSSSEGLYTVPSYNGRPLSLSVNLDFWVRETGYLSMIPEDVSTVLGAIFTGCFINVYFSDGSYIRLRSYDSFVLKDDDSGDVLDPSSESYWDSVKGGVVDFSIWALFDLSDSYDKTINSIYIGFPSSAGQIYYSNENLQEYIALSDVSLNVDFAYSPFDDVVQDDLIDIKDSLSGVNNKLDSISSSMNTIDQDINRVNQTVSDLRDDLTQGDPDIQSSNSDLQDQITDAKNEIGVIDSEVNSIVSDILDKYPDAENPFDAPDVPILSDIWASEFIEELWGFFKAQSIFFTFIHTGLLFCLVSFILRR